MRRRGERTQAFVADVKWRSKGEKVHLHDVLLLEKVMRDVSAHKAVLITNHGFTGNAARAALENGIGLLVVRPEVAETDWHPTDREAIQARIQKLARARRPLYTFAVEQKTYGPEITPHEALGGVAALSAPQVWAAFGGLANPAGAAPPAPSGGGLGGYGTRQGPGAGFRRK